MRLKILAVVVLFAVGVGAAGFVVFGPTFGATDGTRYLTAAATRESVVQSAVATGTVAPSATYGLGFGRDPVTVTSSTSSSASSNSSNSGSGSTSWTVTAVDVKVGDAVTEGEVLATADDGDARLQLAIAQANLASAEAKLTQDGGGVTSADRAVAQDQVNQAVHQLSVARQSYTDTKRQNDLSIRAAQQALAAAKRQLAKDQSAGAANDVISHDKQAVTDAQTNLSQTQARATASNHQAASSIQNASLGVTSARNSYTSRVAGATDAQLAQDRATVVSAEAQVAAAQKTVDGARIRAPSAGIVTVVAIEVGITAPSGDAIRIEAGPMQVTASFAETDLVSLKLGQAAAVSIDAVGNDVTGTVTRIDPVAASSGTSSVVTYAVAVTLSDTPASVLTGMSADVAVTTAQAEDVIAVPSIALTGTSGAYSVRVLDGAGQPELRSVQVGLTTSSTAEIMSGLSEGEAVVIGTSSSRDGTTTGGFGGGIGGGLGGGFRGPNGGNGGPVTQGTQP